MDKVQIFWDPSGFELDSLGTTKISGVPTDGDTPYVRTSIRMLSIDTPEIHYPGNTNPANHDSRLQELAGWIQQGKSPINDDLAAYLVPKINSGSAGTLQKTQGEVAKQHFSQLLADKLTKPNGNRRSVYLRAANEHFDQYGRLLAYMAPSYTSSELETMAYEERATFNLMMVKDGVAATLIIYPSLPKYRDLVLLQKVAKEAVELSKQFWAVQDSLTGYEFRSACRLWKITERLNNGEKLSSRERYGWVERYCADMTTRQIYEPQDYIKVQPYNRIFLWAKDVTEAVGKLNLVPGE
jgi:endonuclease YncB( thermonuclease family)